MKNKLAQDKIKEEQKHEEEYRKFEQEKKEEKKQKLYYDKLQIINEYTQENKVKEIYDKCISQLKSISSIPLNINDQIKDLLEFKLTRDSITNKYQIIRIKFYEIFEFQQEILTYFLRNSVFNKQVYGEYSDDNNIPVDMYEQSDSYSFRYQLISFLIGYQDKSVKDYLSDLKSNYNLSSYLKLKCNKNIHQNNSRHKQLILLFNTQIGRGDLIFKKVLNIKLESFLQKETYKKLKKILRQDQIIKDNYTLNDIIIENYDQESVENIKKLFQNDTCFHIMQRKNQREIRMKMELSLILIRDIEEEQQQQKRNEDESETDYQSQIDMKREQNFMSKLITKMKEQGLELLGLQSVYFSKENITDINQHIPLFKTQNIKLNQPYIALAIMGFQPTQKMECIIQRLNGQQIMMMSRNNLVGWKMTCLVFGGRVYQEYCNKEEQKVSYVFEKEHSYPIFRLIADEEHEQLIVLSAKFNQYYYGQIIEYLLNYGVHIINIKILSNSHSLINIIPNHHTLYYNNNHRCLLILISYKKIKFIRQLLSHLILNEDSKHHVRVIQSNDQIRMLFKTPIKIIDDQFNHHHDTHFNYSCLIYQLDIFNNQHLYYKDLFRMQQIGFQLLALAVFDISFVRDSILDPFFIQLSQLLIQTYNLDSTTEKYTLFQDYFKQFILKNKFMILFLRVGKNMSFNKEQQKELEIINNNSSINEIENMIINVGDKQINKEKEERKQQKIESVSEVLSVMHLQGGREEIVKMIHVSNVNLLEDNSLFEKGDQWGGESVMIIDQRYLKQIEIKYIVKQLLKIQITIKVMFQIHMDPQWSREINNYFNQRIFHFRNHYDHCHEILIADTLDSFHSRPVLVIVLNGPSLNLVQQLLGQLYSMIDFDYIGDVAMEEQSNIISHQSHLLQNCLYTSYDSESAIRDIEYLSAFFQSLQPLSFFFNHLVHHKTKIRTILLFQICQSNLNALLQHFQAININVININFYNYNPYTLTQFISLFQLNSQNFNQQLPFIIFDVLFDQLTNIEEILTKNHNKTSFIQDYQIHLFFYKKYEELNLQLLQQ